MINTKLFGLSGQVINWLESYLIGWTSYVSIEIYLRRVLLAAQREFHRAQFLDHAHLFSTCTPPVSRLSFLHIHCSICVTSIQMIRSCMHPSIRHLTTISTTCSHEYRRHLENNLLFILSKREALITGRHATTSHKVRDVHSCDSDNTINGLDRPYRVWSWFACYNR